METTTYVIVILYIAMLFHHNKAEKVSFLIYKQRRT
jgi:hypothetical protein